MTSTPFIGASSHALAAAVASGDASQIHRLVADGANPNARSDRGLPLLQWAMLQQRRDGFQALLAAGADPAGADASGNTALTLAAQANTGWWLEALLARGASPDTPNTANGETPLMSALLAERPANLARLLRAGAQLDAADDDGNTALHVAAKINQMDQVLALLQAGADPTARNRLGVSFQRYLFVTGDQTLTADVKRDRDAVCAWLLLHRVALEHQR